MKTYTVEDSQTGRTITFDWDGPADPTDRDMEEVFSAAKTFQPSAESSLGPVAENKQFQGQGGAMGGKGASGVWDIPYTDTTLGKVAKHARPYLELGGAAVGGLLAAPANLVAPGVAEALGVAGGYIGGRAAANTLDSVAGIAPPKTVSEQALGTLEDAKTGLEQGLGGPLIGKGIQGVTTLGGKIAKPILGRMSGTGTAAVQEAIDAGEQVVGHKPWASQSDFDLAMRGKIGGKDVVQNAKAALRDMKDARAAEYVQNLANIQQNVGPVSTAPIQAKLGQLESSFRVKRGPPTQANPNGAIDVSEMAIGDVGRSDVKRMIEAVENWKDTSPVGLDALKRYLDDFYSESSQARAFTESLRDTVKNTIVDAVPEYANMTRSYAETTQLIKDLESGLMMRKQGISGRIVDDQTLRRLLSSMKDNFALRKELVDALSSSAGKDIAGQVAGHMMRSPLPMGLAGTGPVMAAEVVGSKLIHPSLLPAVVASSPRVQGEALRLYGKAASMARGTGPMIGKLAAYEAITPDTSQSTVGQPPRIGRQIYYSATGAPRTGYTNLIGQPGYYP